MISRSREVSASNRFLSTSKALFSPRARSRELDCIEKFLITKRLREELNGAAFHRLYRHPDVAMRCNEDDWELPAGCDEFALKIKAALTRQSHVEYQTGGGVPRVGCWSPPSASLLAGLTC